MVFGSGQVPRGIGPIQSNKSTPTGWSFGIACTIGVGHPSHLAYTSVLLRKVEGWTMLNLSLLVLTVPFHAVAPRALTAFPFLTRVVVSLQQPW